MIVEIRRPAEGRQDVDPQRQVVAVEGFLLQADTLGVDALRSYGGECLGLTSQGSGAVAGGDLRLDLQCEPLSVPLDRERLPLFDAADAEHDAMDHALDIFEGYVPVAPRGELSPTSRMSVSFDQKRWPFKPEVVAPGGNLGALASRH